jgi:uncharacterized protein (DUF1015 family)
MSGVSPFTGRLVRQDRARRAVTAMSESQEESGLNLFRVAVDQTAYDDAPPALYVYRQSRGEESWTGIVCDVDIGAIAAGQVRGHEAVHRLRVDALVWHHTTTNAPPALVALLHRAGPEFVRALAETRAQDPVLDFAGPGGLRQTLWRLDDGHATRALLDELAAATLYIADGHHRTTAALEEWRSAGEPAGAGLLCVVHAVDGLSLSAFHRRVAGPVDPRGLLALLHAEFDVREVDAAPMPEPGTTGVYVGRRWFHARLPQVRPEGTAGLDVTVLHSRVLDRLDPAPLGRTPKIDTIPSGAPLGELVARCDVDGGALFTLAPPPPGAVIEVADAGEVMPPKTTYFEPKPAAGIFLRGEPAVRQSPRR